MKVKYKPWNANWVEFDPATELVCPQCGKIKSIPFGWKPNSIMVCDDHSTAMFDIGCIVGKDLEVIPILLKMGRLDEANISEWNKKRIEWLIIYTCGDVPKWKVEPFPMGYRR